MMVKRMIIALAVSVALGQTALAAAPVVGFSQIGSESGWRSAETKVAKTEAEKRGYAENRRCAAKAGKPN